MNYFVTAIGTDSGKTVISSILVEYLGAGYWKPIQCGAPRDTDTVRELTQPERARFFSERHFLQMPASPHAAARAEGVEIHLEDFHPPVSNRSLVIEGAGGLLVPMNDEHYLIDLTTSIDCAVVLVCNLYLGSINHSLLSIEALKNRGAEVLGIVFNGPSNPASEEIIEKKSPWPCLLRVQQHKEVDHRMIEDYAQQLRSSWGDDFEKLQQPKVL